LGLQSWANTPTFRGFDHFYGYYTGAIGYFSKLTQSGYFDVHDGEELVSDAEVISEDMHLTTLLQLKVEDAIFDHAANHSDLRLFLYYAQENVHTGSALTGADAFLAPEEFLNMCNGTVTTSEDGLNLQAYCALVIMMDRAIGDTVCAIESAGMADNTIMVVASDNGGYGKVSPSNFPFRGNKGGYVNGGVKTAAFLYGPPAYIPESARGLQYEGLVHMTDWYATILGLASRGTFDGVPMSGNEIDGLDVFEAIVMNSSSPRTEIFVNYDEERGDGAMQIGDYRLIVGDLPGPGRLDYWFEAGSTFDDAPNECTYDLTSSAEIITAMSYSFANELDSSDLSDTDEGVPDGETDEDEPEARKRRPHRSLLASDVENSDSEASSQSGFSRFLVWLFE
jgi:hypothetical protein